MPYPPSGNEPTVPSKPVVKLYPTPDLRDRVFFERVDSRKGGFVLPEKGAPYEGRDPERMEGFVFATAQPTDTLGWLDLFWLNQRLNEDAYNYTVEYPWVSESYPRVTRSYVTLREDWADPVENTPDPAYPELRLVDYKIGRIEDPVLDALFVSRSVVYERLPADVAYTADKESSVLPYKFRVAVPGVMTSSVELGPAQVPMLGKGDWSASQKTTTAFRKTVDFLRRFLPSSGVTLTGYKLTRDKQVATVVDRWHDSQQTLAPSATMIEGEVEPVGDGTSLRSTSTVPSVFPAEEFTKEASDNTPQKFKAAAPAVGTAVTFEGQAAYPTLAPGDIQRSEEQLDEFNKRTKLLTRAGTPLPITLVDKNTNEAKQEVTRYDTLQLTTAPQASPTATRDVKVENIGDGRVVETVDEVPEVFANEKFGIEIPDIIPPEFRVLAPTTMIGITAEGEASPPLLGEGELAKTEDQITDFTFRTETTSRDLTQLPQTLTDHELDGIDARGSNFGGVFDIEKTLDRAPQSVEEGFDVVASAVKNLGNGLTTRQTKRLSRVSGATIEVTDPGTGYVLPPDVTFTGGDLGSGAAGTAVLALDPGTGTGSERADPGGIFPLTYASDGDTNGVFYFIGSRYNNGTWKNPVTKGPVKISEVDRSPYAPDKAVDYYAGSLDRKTNTDTAYNLNDNDGSSHLLYDLGVGRTLAANKISFQAQSTVNAADSISRFLKVDGSNDNETWSAVGLSVIDLPVTSAGWVTVDADPTSAFRYFRVYSTDNEIPPGGQDPPLFPALVFAEFEMYGTLEIRPALNLAHSYNGDLNGVFTYLGKRGGGGVWRNPHTNGDLTITSSNLVAGTLDQIVDHSPSNVQISTTVSDGFYDFELPAGVTLAPNKLAFRQRGPGRGNRTTPIKLRGQIEGESTWTTLMTSSIVPQEPSHWRSYDVPGETPYKKFRVTGPQPGFTVGEVELYGTLFLTTNAEVDPTAVKSVLAVTMTNAGLNYQNPPVVTFVSNDAGSGAEGVAILLGNSVQRVDMTSIGSGYLVAPDVVFSNADGSTPTATAEVGFAVASLVLDTSGSNYDTPPSVDIEGDGSGAYGRALIGKSINRIDMIERGAGYSSTPTVAISGGTSAAATAVRSFVVASVAVTAPGSGYTSDPGALPPTGSASFKVTRGLPLLRVGVTAGGTGYTSAPTVNLNSAGGTGAAGTAVLGFSLDSVQMTAQGSGYVRTPTVRITGGGGSLAKATAQLAGYAVASVTLSNAGSGYSTPPAVDFSSPDGTGAAATAVLGYGVASAAVTAGGSGYSSATVAFSGGGGSGATGTVQLTGDVVIGVTITAPGSGYTSAPTATISGDGTGATATTTLATTGSIKQVNVTAGGAGYSSVTVSIVGAAAYATLSASQAILLTLTQPGVNYSSAPLVEIVGGGGSGATATATLKAAGSVKSVTLTAPGTGFTGNPVVTFSGGAGGGAAATGVRNTSAAGVVASVAVVNPGENYASGFGLVFSGGGGNGAAANAVLSTTGVISSVIVTNNGGTNFATPPIVTFSGGGSPTTPAAAVAVLNTAGVVKSLVLDSGGSGFTSAPLVRIRGDSEPAATAHSTLAATGSVKRVILTNEGGPFTEAPVVVFSYGNAVAIYILPSGWPVLIETQTDTTERIVTVVTKSIVPALAELPTGFVEIYALDKWRSLQITSRIDLSRLPATERYMSSQNVSLPAALVAVYPIWDTSRSSQSTLAANGLSGSTSSTVSVHGSIIVEKKQGFRGAALAKIERAYFFGPPPDSAVPAPTIIRTSSGTAIIVSGSNSTSNSGSTIDAPLNAAGEIAQIGDAMPGGGWLAGLFTVLTASSSGSSSGNRSNIVDISDVLTSGLSIGGGFAATETSTTDDEDLPSSSSAAGSFRVHIPPSCPLSLPPGFIILADVDVERWRFGLYVRTLTYVIVPEDCG